MNDLPTLVYILCEGRPLEHYKQKGESLRANPTEVPSIKQLKEAAQHNSLTKMLNEHAQKA